MKLFFAMAGRLNAVQERVKERKRKEPRKEKSARRRLGILHYPTLPGSGANGVGAGTAVGMRVEAGKGEVDSVGAFVGCGDAVCAALGIGVCIGDDEKTIACVGTSA